MRGARLFGAVAGLVAAQFYLLRLVQRNFIYQESSSSINFGSLERKSDEIAAKNESESFHLPKTLLFITSHFSESHNMFLQSCWPHSIARSKLLQNSNVLVISTGLANRTLLKTMFTNYSLEVHEIPNPGYQEGAKLALMYAFNNNLFESYDWVIRLNPDVIIRNDSKILAGIMNPAFDGIFVDCILFQTRVQLHTDWSAFRPSAIPFNKTNFTKLAEIDLVGNAEDHFTFLMSPILHSGRFQMLPGTKPENTRICRVLGDSIIHHHEYFMDCVQDFETDSTS